MSALEREVHEGLRDEIVQQVGRHRFHLWFRDTAVSRVDGERITLAVPSEVHRAWLEFTYGEVLRKACARILGEGVKVSLEVSESQGALRTVRERLPHLADEWEALLGRRRPAPTLDSFVARTGENFPVVLLQQLVHGSGTVDPPSIYLLGEAGSGKSHLLQALHAAAERAAPGESLYLTSRRFTNLFVSAVRAGGLDAVRAFEVDVGHRRLVIVDGIEALAGRPATASELVRLRERAVGTETRFVFAGRRHPREVEELSPRLRSWLLGGVVVRLKTPDRELLCEVLESRARRFGVVLPEAVRDAILLRTGSVAGAVEVLDRWAAASAEVGSLLEPTWLDEIAPTVAMTAKDEVVRRVKDAVARHFGVPRGLLDRPTKVRSAVRPRQLAMYLVYRATALPLGSLGRAFGLRSHSSVSKAIQDVRAARESDPDLEQVLDGLLARI